MNGYTTMVYVVQGRAWWGFSAKEWIAFFPLALAGVRSGEGYELPDTNRLTGRPKCAQRIDGADAWYPDRYDTEIFYLPGWDLEAGKEQSVIMQESDLLENLRSAQTRIGQGHEEETTTRLPPHLQFRATQ